MNRTTRENLMRKTKHKLIDLIDDLNQDLELAKSNVKIKQGLANTHRHTFNKIEGKYEHLKTKHSTLNIELGRKNTEISQLKNAYMDALELNVELLQEKVG